MTGPALADFESAVAAYEDGAYREAQTEFEALAAAGDERAEPYLEGIRRRLSDEEPTDESFTSTLMDSVTSIFGEFDVSSDVSESWPASGGWRSSEGWSGSASVSADS